jgi:hypothetical protein
MIIIIIVTAALLTKSLVQWVVHVVFVWEVWFNISAQRPAVLMEHFL